MHLPVLEKYSYFPVLHIHIQPGDTLQIYRRLFSQGKGKEDERRANGDGRNEQGSH